MEIVDIINMAGTLTTNAVLLYWIHTELKSHKDDKTYYRSIIERIMNVRNHQE